MVWGPRLGTSSKLSPYTPDPPPPNKTEGFAGVHFERVQVWVVLGSMSTSSPEGSNCPTITERVSGPKALKYETFGVQALIVSTRNMPRINPNKSLRSLLNEAYESLKGPGKLQKQPYSLGPLTCYQR